MALIEYIKIGSLPNDGTGDPLRVAFEKINRNFGNIKTGGSAHDPQMGIQFKQVVRITSIAFTGTNWLVSAYPNRLYRGTLVTALVPLDDLVLSNLGLTTDGQSAIQSIASNSLGHVLAVGLNRKVLKSLDHGASWTVCDMSAVVGAGVALREVKWDSTNNKWWIVGDNATVLTTTDITATTIAWASIGTGYAYDYFSVAFPSVDAAGAFTPGVALIANVQTSTPNADVRLPPTITRTGHVVVSGDGVVWSEVPLPVTNGLNSATHDGTYYWAVGDSGVILRSQNLTQWDQAVPSALFGSKNLRSLTTLTYNSVTYRLVVGDRNLMSMSIDSTGATWSTINIDTVLTTPVVLYTAATIAVTTGTGATLQTNYTMLAAGDGGSIVEITPQTPVTNISGTNRSLEGQFDATPDFIYDSSNSNVWANANILPQVDNVKTLGIVTHRWKRGYINEIDLGNAFLSSNAGNALIVSNPVTGNLANFAAQDATFNKVTGNEASFNSMYGIQDLAVQNVVATRATISSITSNVIVTNQISGNLATFSTVIGTDATFTGTVTTGNVISTNVTAQQGRFINLAANTANIDGNLTVNGSASITGPLTATLSANSSAQPNITSLGILSNLTVTAPIIGNLDGTASNANYALLANHANTANQVTDNYQPNITRVGTLTQLEVSGNTVLANLTFTPNSTLTVPATSSANFVGPVVANLITANSVVASIFTGNLHGTANHAIIANHANTANQVTDNYQPNITRVGTLTDLTVSNTIVGNINGRAYVANFADYANMAFRANTVTDSYQPNITQVGNLVNLKVLGNVDANTVNAIDLYGNIRTASQPYITQVGNLVSLNVEGNIRGANLVANYEVVTPMLRANLIEGYLITTSQPNIHRVGNLVDLNVDTTTTTGNLVVTNWANINNLISNSANFGTLKVGTLNAGVVNANVITGNVRAVGGIGAVQFSSNTEFITGNANTFKWIESNNTLILANVTSRIQSRFIDATFTANSSSQPNITFVGTLRTAHVANFLFVEGNNNNLANGEAFKVVGGLSNIANGLKVLNGAYIDGNFTSDYANVVNFNQTGIGARFNVNFPVIDIGANSNGTDFIGSNTPDRAIMFHYWNTANVKNEQPAVIWDVQTREFVLSTDTVRHANGQLDAQGLANIRVHTISGNISGNLSGNANLTSLTVTGISNLGNAANFRLYGGNEGDVLISNGDGNVRWIDGAGIGGFPNIIANGNTFTPNISNSIAIYAGKVAFCSNRQVETVGINAYISTSNIVPHKIELRVTPTGILIDSPYLANIDYSSTANNLLADFNMLNGEIEHNSNWMWDHSLTPQAGLICHDLGTIT